MMSTFGPQGGLGAPGIYARPGARRRASSGYRRRVDNGEGSHPPACLRSSSTVAVLAPSGRFRGNPVPAGAAEPRPGDVASVRISYGAPHHLVADLPEASAGHPAVDPVFAVRRTRAGDAWERRHLAPGSVDPVARTAVPLGVPGLRSR